MKLALALAVVLAACHPAPVTAPRPPARGAALGPAPVGFRPDTGCVLGSSAGMLTVVLAPGACDLAHVRGGDLVIVLPLDTAHPMPPRLCRRVAAADRAYLGHAGHPVVVTGDVCADVSQPTGLTAGTLDFDLVVDGERVHGGVPLAAFAARD